MPDHLAPWLADRRPEETRPRERCSCTEIDDEWQGGDHVVAFLPGTRIHFYPDPITESLVILRIVSDEERKVGESNP